MTFIPEAYTQTAATTLQGTAELFNTLLMFGLIFLVFYFLVMRPQKKKMKQHREMLGVLRRGDRIVTGGGIIGLVIRVVNEQEIVLEIADNVRVRVVRDTIASVIAKTEPIGVKTKADGEEAVSSTPQVETTGNGEGKSSIPGLKKLLSGKDK